MITFTGILVLMLAYAALSLGTICLFWHLSRREKEQRWQRKAIRPLDRYRLSPRMADSLFTFERATVFVAIVTAAVTALAYQSDLGRRSITPGTGLYASVAWPASYTQDDGRAVNQLANEH
jgi:hypothetical protein